MPFQPTAVKFYNGNTVNCFRYQEYKTLCKFTNYKAEPTQFNYIISTSFSLKAKEKFLKNISYNWINSKYEL